VRAIPRIYLTPAELQSLPLGLAISGTISALPPGTLDQMLARASQRCDAYCEKRLQAPGATTLAQSASAGASRISVTSTLTLDQLAEQAAILDLGQSTQETVLIESGGVTVTNWQAPYPGTLTLDPSTPLLFSHSQGATVTYCYKEVREAITASQSDPYSEALMSQAAQLALAHLPPIHLGLTRLVFLKAYPVITVYTLEHAYSFDTTYHLIYTATDPSFTGQIIVEPTAGFVRFRVGTVVLPQGLCRTTYVGGFTSIPDDIKGAVAYYLADDLMRISNPYMATDTTQGKRRQAYQMQGGRTPNVQMAEAILEPYRRHV
jgi:hypothetical protein